MVRLYKKISDNHHVIAQGTRVSEFKRQLSHTEDLSEFSVYFSHADGTCEKLEDDDILDERLQTCALELVPNNESATLDELHFEASRDLKEHKPYSWFYTLSNDVRNQRVTQKQALLLGYAMEDYWPSTLMLLGFEKSNVEILVQDKRGLNIPNGTCGLIHWIQKFASRATLQALVDTLRLLDDVKTGLINWDKIMHIVKSTVSSQQNITTEENHYSIIATQQKITTKEKSLQQNINTTENRFNRKSLQQKITTTENQQNITTAANLYNSKSLKKKATQCS
ncbi:hypothetical protein BgiMline_036077 [Biomphalaria glabrata]